MSRPLVERYEQIISQDPASTVFVELAKALIDSGDHARAIEVCQNGLTHHQKSVMGRVLWGKALINLGKASEAMNQFDLAMKIDRENPHAYNLISEVLLKKGLYRSALPILRKASALSPNDGRIQGWLEQTKAALAGGPKPIVTDDSTAFDEQKSAKVAEAPVAGLGATDASAMPTVVTAAYDPDAAAEEPTQGNRVPADAAAAAPLGTAAEAAGRDSATQVMSAPKADAAQPPDPFAALTGGTPLDDETVRGLTSTFDALQDGAGAEFAVPKETTQRGEGAEAPAGAVLGGAPDEPSVIPSRDLYGAPPAAPAPAPQAGLLEDVVSMAMDVPTGARRAMAEPPSAPPPPAESASGGRRGLLDEIPEEAEPSSQVEVPKVDLNTQATEAIAREYERELREKLAKKQLEKTWLQRNGLKLGLGLGLGVILLGLGGSFIYTRVKFGGKDLPTTLAEARSAINADTRADLQKALAALDNAAKMDSDDAQVWALTALAHATLYADHGHTAADKAKAVDALARPGVRDAFPELALVADYLVAEGSQQTAARQALLSSQLDKTEVQALAGEILLRDGKGDEALKRLTRAVENLKANVRALVALGDYYLEERDHENAYSMFASEAAKASPNHAGRLLGLAEARLELGKEQAESLAEVETLTREAGLPERLYGRREMVLARLLASQGRNADALKVLDAVAKEFPNGGFEFEYGMGVAWRGAGNMAEAQKSFEAALKRVPKSEDAREGLGRVLLARSRERELLQRLEDPGSRRVSMVRGIAYTRVKEWKKARAEFARTMKDNKYPAEAVIYLAVADANEEQLDKAQGVLEKLEKNSRRNRAAIQVALGRVYWQKGDLKKARAAFEDAASDSLDFEGNAALGELLLTLGLPDAALEPLQRAVDRNGSHGPARHNLVRTLLALPERGDDALTHATAGAEDNPGSFEAQKDLALALLRNGRSKDALAAIEKALKIETSDSEVFRLRAQILFARGNPRDAFSALERSNKLNSKDAETFCEIGFGFNRQGQADTGVKAFEAAVREDGKSFCGQVGPFHCKPYGGKPIVDRLEALAKGAVSANDRALALSAKARVLLTQGGQLSEARAAADEALKNAPFDGLAWYALSQVALKQKDDQKAKEALLKAAELEPAHGAVRLALGDLLVRLGSEEELPRAIREYEDFLVVSQSEGDVGRVKKLLPNLKKRLQK